MNNYIIVFKNTHDAIQGEKVLKEKGLSIMVMPTPTSITHSCGISVRFSQDDIGIIKKAIDEEEFTIKNIYIKNGQKFELYK